MTYNIESSPNETPQTNRQYHTLHTPDQKEMVSCATLQYCPDGQGEGVMSFWKLFPRSRPKILKLFVKVVVEHDNETGEYWATAPALPGLFEVGDSQDAVLDLMTDGILVYLESLYLDSKPVPVGPDFVVEIEDYPVKLGGTSVADDDPPYQWATTKWHIPKKPVNSLQESSLQEA